MIIANEITITPTIFPDKTSQIWQLPEQVLKYADIDILWEFENESEFIHLAQLVDLAKANDKIIYLRMPYLPYARQDKNISNESTFALHTFCKLINTLDIEQINIVDAHNKKFCRKYMNNYVDEPIFSSLQAVRDVTNCTKICYPDAGAKERYKHCVLNSLPSCSFSKTRNQETGYIENLFLNELTNIENESILIIDDLCDGGMTFKLTAERLYELGASEVHLYVSHGLFTKGIDTLRESGIRRIFTHKGEVK